MTSMNEMHELNEHPTPLATGPPMDDPTFVAHEDFDIFCALGCDLRGHEPGCDGADVEECDFNCGECERNCDLED